MRPSAAAPPRFAEACRRSCRPPHTQSREFPPPLWQPSPPLGRVLVKLHRPLLHLQYKRGGKKAQVFSFLCNLTVILAKCDGNVVIFAYCDVFVLHFLWILTSRAKFYALCNMTMLCKMKKSCEDVTGWKAGFVYTKNNLRGIKTSRWHEVWRDV